MYWKRTDIKEVINILNRVKDTYRKEFSCNEIDAINSACTLLEEYRLEKKRKDSEYWYESNNND